MKTKRMTLVAVVALGFCASTFTPVAHEQATQSEVDLVWIEKLVDEAKGRGWLGLGFAHTIQTPGHFAVDYVHAQGAAEQGGVALGDVLVGIDDLRFDTSDFALAQGQLSGVISKVKPGQSVKLLLLRNSRFVEVEVIALSYRSHSLASFIGWRALDQYYRQNPSRFSAR